MDEDDVVIVGNKITHNEEMEQEFSSGDFHNNHDLIGIDDGYRPLDDK